MIHRFIFREPSVPLQFKPFACVSALNVENSDARGSTGLSLTVYDVSVTYPHLQSVDTDYEAHPVSNSVGTNFLPVRTATGA